MNEHVSSGTIGPANVSKAASTVLGLKKVSVFRFQVSADLWFLVAGNGLLRISSSAFRNIN